MTGASCLYEGHLRHRRFFPVVNRFRYRVFFLYLDLAELPTLFQGRWLWSADRVNLAYFRRRDHLGDPRVPLEQAVGDLVAARTGTRPKGPIRLLTHLRYFGYCFNPASFYYCYDPAGERVTTIVVEVHNTPWGRSTATSWTRAKMSTGSLATSAFSLPRPSTSPPSSPWTSGMTGASPSPRRP